jgi:ribonuclease-3
MEQEVNQELEKVIGHHFHAQGLLEEALEESGLASAGNARLALVGDKILDLMLLRRWYREGNTTGMPTPSRMDISLIYTEQGTSLLQTYACNKQLTSTARVLDLQRFIHQRPDLERNVPNSTLATTVEAILGAVWLDSNEDVQQVDEVMEKIGLYPSSGRVST